jgi:frataxin
VCTLQQPNALVAPIAGNKRRFFQSEADFHSVADETLDVIQDVMEEIFEDIRGDEEDMEVSVASGVLTLSLPPHGTWVINKQTPNRQLWWSSPVSGPRRFEYENGKWVCTRSEDEPFTLDAALTQEIKKLYNVDLEIAI